MSGAVTPMRTPDMPVSELIDRYMADYAGRDSTRSQRLGWWRVQLGALRLVDVSDDHVHAALEALKVQPARRYAGRDADGRPIFKAKKRDITPATLNRYRAAISAVFTYAIKRRIAPKGWIHPCQGVETLPENNARVRFLKPDEIERLLQACRAARWDRLYLLVLMGLTTGARRGELEGLRWQDVDFDHAVAHVARSKNADPKTLPLTAPVVEELKRFHGAPSALVFASSRRPGQVYAFDQAWKAALKAAGIRNYRLHDNRHTAASMLAQNGATLLEVAEVLGHRTLAMSRRYSHLAAGHKAALVTRVMGAIR